MNVLEIQNLSKSYDGKNWALKDCSFQLSSGKICAVIGESGSGKSTLIRLIAGLEHPENGTIIINEKEMSSDHHIVPPQKRNIGLVFQNFALFPHLTVEENIAFGLKNKDKVKELLQLIKMEDFSKRYPAELSGGQQQRVAIARTLALSPQLLLLDEPFSSLDSHLKADLRNEIKNIVNEIGISMVFITHDILDAIDIADEIIFLKKGAIIQHSSTANIFKNLNNIDIQNIKNGLQINSEKILQLINSQ